MGHGRGHDKPAPLRRSQELPTFPPSLPPYRSCLRMYTSR